MKSGEETLALRDVTIGMEGGARRGVEGEEGDRRGKRGEVLSADEEGGGERREMAGVDKDLCGGEGGTD